MGLFFRSLVTQLRLLYEKKEKASVTRTVAPSRNVSKSSVDASHVHRQALAHFHNRVKDFDLHPENPGSFIGGGAHGAFDVNLRNGDRVIGKNGFFLGAEDAIQKHHSFHKLAHMAGSGHMVLPAVKITSSRDHMFPNLDPEKKSYDEDPKIEKGQSLYLTPHAGQDYASADLAPLSHLGKISESDKTAGLFLHTLSGFQDGHAGNVLVNHHGAVKLIDPELTFGENPWDDIVGSVFNQELKPQQGQLSDHQTALLHRLRNGTKQRVGKDFGLSEKAAENMKNRASMIHQHGLLRAADMLDPHDPSDPSVKTPLGSK